MSEKGCRREISSLRSTDHEGLVEKAAMKTNHMGAEKNEIESLSPKSTFSLCTGFWLSGIPGRPLRQGAELHIAHGFELSTLFTARPCFPRPALNPGGS